MVEKKNSSPCWEISKKEIKKYIKMKMRFIGREKEKRTTFPVDYT